MKKNLLALLFGLVVAFVILEVFLKLFNPFPFRLRGNRIFLQANRQIVIANNRIPGLDSTIIHTKNALGFRGPEKPRDFDASLSIVTVGGSTTECYYIPDNKTWSALLQDRLQQRYANVWVNNAGLDGHSTFGHKILLEEFLVTLKPKMLVFLVGCNDVGRNDLGDDRNNLFQYERFPMNIIIRSEVATTLVNLMRVVRAHKNGLMHGAIDLNTNVPLVLPAAAHRIEIEKHSNTYIENYQKRIKALIEICRKNGIEPVFVTQPSLLGNGSDDITGTNLETYRLGESNNGKLSWEILNLYNTALKTTAAEQNVFVIDLAAQLPKSSRYFYDQFHFNNAGAAAVAEIVSKDLQTHLDAQYARLKK